ncbi:ABC transporter substrate-binding protein [Enterococcus avium]|jgi:galactofuranose transport system substrate-binding protein|uniref:ABC transporter substrate-binding protein n=1 Tax=Enterococcus avium TaxID=33945 RepID=UPI0012ABB6AB|nr:ABC transporter substrate-binding protein [Enterococcus avium]
MKKINLLLLIGLCLMLAGCKQETPKENHSEITIGFAQAGIESNWRKIQSKSIKEELEKQNYQVMSRNSFSDPKQQYQDVMTFIAYQVDLIILSPIEEFGWEPVLEEAKKANIPVIIVDRNIATNRSDLFLTHIGSSFKAQGGRAGLYVTNHYQKIEKEAINVFEIKGVENSSPTRLRHDGFAETVGRDPRIQITQTITGDFIRLKAKEKFSEAIEAGKLNNIDVIYSHNDEMTLGALDALDEHQLENKFVVVSIDAQKEMIDLLKQRKVNCVVECNPFMGELVANTVKRYFDNKTISEDIYVSDTVFSDQNSLSTIPPRNY